MALARWQSTIVDNSGLIQSAASVEVRRESDSVLMSLFTDRAGTISAGNPVLADSDGYVYFHIEGGAYKITATKAGFSRVWRYVGVGLAGESDTSVLEDGTLLQVTNPATEMPMTGFGSVGYTVKGIVGLQATWDSGAGVNGAALVLDTVVDSTAGPFGAPSALFAGLRIEADIASVGLSPPTVLDPACIVASVWNEAAVTFPKGAALWGIIRGPSGSNGEADAIRATSECTDAAGNPVAQHPRAGLVVFNSDAINAFEHGVWVYSAQDYGIRVGGTPSIASQITPAIPIAVHKTVGVTSADGLVLENQTAAAAGAQQWSPRVRWRGRGWKTDVGSSPVVAASIPVDWVAEARPYQGVALPGVDLVFAFQVNDSVNFDSMTLRAGGGLAIGGDAPASSLVGGDLQLGRPGGTTGAVFFGTSGSKYLHYDATNFNLVGGSLVLDATTTYASLRFLDGAAPSAPTDGDMWREDNTNTGWKIRINGVTKTVTVA